jgi:hypothetical protein
MSVYPKSKDGLKDQLILMLKDKADKHDVNIDKTFPKTPEAYFGKLIEAVSNKYKKKVVILIEEYDTPLMDKVSNLEIAKEYANVLYNFFAILKSPQISPFIHFTFVTGITRFALALMDFCPHHFCDITLEPKYGGICGFTEDEFDTLFMDRMEITLSKLRSQNNTSFFRSK